MPSPHSYRVGEVTFKTKAAAVKCASRLARAERRVVDVIEVHRASWKPTRDVVVLSVSPQQEART